MFRFVAELTVLPVTRAARNFIFQIQEINKRYSEPHIKTTPMVKFALVMLRLYLVLLVGILFFKFFTTLAK
jgi:hypothetical protein